MLRRPIEVLVPRGQTDHLKRTTVLAVLIATNNRYFLVPEPAAAVSYNHAPLLLSMPIAQYLAYSGREFTRKKRLPKQREVSAFDVRAQIPRNDEQFDIW